MDKCLEDDTQACDDPSLMSDAVTEAGGDDGTWSSSLSSDVMRDRLSRSLELTRCELTACKDCCDEAEYHLNKLTPRLPSKQTRMLSQLRDYYIEYR